MARLLRPHIPLSVRVAVACGQLRSMFRCSVDRNAGEADSAYLPRVLTMLSLRLGGGPLQLDHDPALENREQVFRNGEHVGYRPDANDGAFLIFRTREGHRTKTFVSGDHGQYCDTILAARERNRKRKAAGKVMRRKDRKGDKRQGAAGRGRQARKLKSANRWPPRGSRPVNWRKGNLGHEEKS